MRIVLFLCLLRVIYNYVCLLIHVVIGTAASSANVNEQDAQVYTVMVCILQDKCHSSVSTWLCFVTLY